jgi:hypothetical protein
MVGMPARGGAFAVGAWHAASIAVPLAIVGVVSVAAIRNVREEP